MNRILFFLSIIVLLSSLFACQEEFEPGGTEVQEMAGTWVVLYNHGQLGVDPFGVGKTELVTYNSSENVTTEMWLNDQGHFWDYKVKLPVNLESLTFGTEDTLVNAIDGYDIKVLVRNGKILENAATPPSGSSVDSIYFELWFEDLEGATGIADDTLFVSGYRYTGWPEDE